MIEIRDNITSVYMLLSDSYIGILMVLTFFITSYWVPYRMKDYHVPIFLRDGNSSLFFDSLFIRLLWFVYFISLSATLS
jgi:hypothetical protein